MGTVSDALDEEVAARALEVALDVLRKRMTASEPRQLEAELVELDAKISRALDLAIDHGDVAAVNDRLRDLKAEPAPTMSQAASIRRRANALTTTPPAPSIHPAPGSGSAPPSTSTIWFGSITPVRNTFSASGSG
jgi:uncharacterized protein (DUF2267 family)